MNQYDEFMRVLDALDTHHVEYILIGGFAVFLHGMPRFTNDLDIFLKMAPENIKQFQRALNSVFKDPVINEITLTELQSYAVIRYGTPHDFYIDILAKLGEVATYDSLEYETLEYKGIKVRIATPQTLFDLKKGTLRLKDKQDAFFLHEIIKSETNNE